MYPRCDHCGEPITGGIASNIGMGGARHYHMGGCPKQKPKPEILSDLRTEIYKAVEQAYSLGEEGYLLPIETVMEDVERILYKLGTGQDS